MKPVVYITVGIFLGFSIAWLIKQEKAVGGSIIASQRTGREHPLRTSVPARALTDHAAADFFKRMQEAGVDQEQRNALFTQIPDGEIPALLANLQKHAGFYGLKGNDKDALRGLLTTWYLQSPAAAQAWLQCVGDDGQLNKLVGGIAEDLAGNDLDVAMDLLRRQGTERLGIDAFSSALFDAALSKGVDALLELCRLGLYRGEWRGRNSGRLNYPEGFDFQRLLDGLAEMKATLGKDAEFMALPGDMIEEWTRRDPQAAWAWLERGEPIDGGEKLEFFISYAKVAEPAAVGALLAKDFKPDLPLEDRYKNIQYLLSEHPSPALIDAFIEAAPGDRAEHLRGMLDGWRGYGIEVGEIDPGFKLILEHMEPPERLAGLRSIFSGSADYGSSDKSRREITPLLLSLGHSEEEIRALFTPETRE